MRCTTIAFIMALFARVPAVWAQADAMCLHEQRADWFDTATRAAPGQWGIAIADQKGQVLWSMNPDASLMPASAVKLFTTGYARSVLGGGARRATRLVGSGVVDPKSGEWLGEWELQVNGDASLERAEGSG